MAFSQASSSVDVVPLRDAAQNEVSTEIHDGALWITLLRPKAMNAITPAMVVAINAALDVADGNAEVKAVVLTGTGAAFCAGADLKYIRGQLGVDSAGVSHFLNAVLAMMARLESFPLPVIAAVNGLALAGGLELVLCCDLVIAGRSARLGDAHGNLGLLPGGGASVRLPRKIGVTRAKYLLFTGDLLPAAELVAAGLVNELVDDDELGAATRRLVAKLASKSALALRRVKALVDDGLEQPRATALRMELLASELHTHSHDMNEGVAAFAEKRTPRFQGR
jgi:enoyl-CoA hydratase